MNRKIAQIQSLVKTHALIGPRLGAYQGQQWLPWPERLRSGWDAGPALKWSQEQSKRLEAFHAWRQQFADDPVVDTVPGEIEAQHPDGWPHDQEKEFSNIREWELGRKESEFYRFWITGPALRFFTHAEADGGLLGRVIWQITQKPESWIPTPTGTPETATNLQPLGIHDPLDDVAIFDPREQTPRNIQGLVLLYSLHIDRQLPRFIREAAMDRAQEWKRWRIAHLYYAARYQALSALGIPAHIALPLFAGHYPTETAQEAVQLLCLIRTSKWNNQWDALEALEKPK